MNYFIFGARVFSAGLTLLVTLSVQAISQDRDSVMRRCLFIADVNQRIDCLETGVVPDSGAASTSNTNPAKQPSVNPSFDCRATRTSIERAICGDVTLSDWDSRMGRVFQQALPLAKDRQSFLENQRLWLIQRDHSCGAVADTAIWSCLLEMTKSRASALANAASIAEATPTAQPSAAPASPATLQSRAELRSNEAPGGRTAPSPPPALHGDNSVAASPQNGGVSLGILLVVFVLGTAVALSVFRNIARKHRLVATYGEEIAARILAREVWQGMTCEQLTESRGSPSDMGREIIKEKTKETWKYHQIGKNRFRERIYLENGIVIGWKY
jgi:uncharacterized protein